MPRCVEINAVTVSNCIEKMVARTLGSVIHSGA
jgi:hypothetical protein